MLLASLSDMHLGSQNTTREEREGIAACLDTLGKMGLTHLVLPGDIFDIWTAPAEMKPPTYEDILKGDDLVVPALQRLVVRPNLTVAYQWGNHDFDLPADLFRTFFRAAQVDTSFTLGNLWVEHGHAYDLFNASGPGIMTPDPAKGNRPLGYYITRIHTRAGRVVSALNSSAYVQNVMEQVQAERQPGRWTVATLVLDYVVRQTGRSYNDEVVMPDGSRIPIWAISEAYADSFRAWEEKHGLFDAINAILVGAEYMDHSAQDVRNQHGKRLVVFGHSHKALWNDLTVGDGVAGAYVNDGAWCKTPQTLVVVEQTGGKYYVQQGTWNGSGLDIEERVITDGWEGKPATFATGRPR